MTDTNKKEFKISTTVKAVAGTFALIKALISGVITIVTIYIVIKYLPEIIANVQYVLD